MRTFQKGKLEGIDLLSFGSIKESQHQCINSQGKQYQYPAPQKAILGNETQSRRFDRGVMNNLVFDQCRSLDKIFQFLERGIAIEREREETLKEEEEGSIRVIMSHYRSTNELTDYRQIDVLTD